MEKKLIRNFSIISFIVLVVVLAILAGGQLDYQISVSLVHPGSIWAEFFNLFGEQPAFWALLVGTVILSGTHKRTNVIWHIVCTFFGYLFTYVFSYMILFMPVRYVYEFNEHGIPQFAMAIVAVAGAAATVYFQRWASKNTEMLIRFRKHALFLIVLSVSEMILVNVLKGVWGRPRMRSIDSIDGFRYWFQISGPAAGEEFKSFPSGHTANAFMMIAFSVFVPYFRKINQKVFVIFAVLWGVLVAFSRVVLGAHFLSDVFVGCYVTLFLFLLFHWVFFRKDEEVKKK